MLLKEILTERLRKVAKREKDSPHPMHDDPDFGWIFHDAKANATAVVENILGDKVTDDESKLKPGMFLLSHTWGAGPMFSEMDMAPGMGGAIGLRDLLGTSARDIAEAAHEAFHAKLQQNKKNFSNEKLVNKLTVRWLQDHLSGMFLHATIETIEKSKRSYKDKKYVPSKKWLADYKKKYG